MKRTHALWCANSLAFAWTLLGCTPPPRQVESADTQPQTSTTESESGPRAIPWAEGDAPGDGESQTRDVAEQPPSMDDPMESDDPQDGVITDAPKGRCSGKATPALKAELQVRAQQVEACGEKLPEGRRSVQGMLRYSLKISPDGRVQDLSKLDDSVGVPEIVNCAKETLSKRFEEHPERGCAQFVLPIEFDVRRDEE